MKYLHRYIMLLAAVILLLVLSSCADDANQLPGIHDANGYYMIYKNTVRFVDEASGCKGYRGFPLCAQPGCKHIDDACQAWIENSGSFQTSGDNMYVIQMSELGVYLIEKNLSNGKERTIASWENTKTDNEEIMYLAAGLEVSNGYALLATEETKLSMNDLELAQESCSCYWHIDLSTGEKTPLWGEDSAQKRVENFHHNQVLVAFEYCNPNLLSEAEYISMYGEDANYNQYTNQATKYELRLYDLTTETYRIIASEGYEPGIDPQANNGTLSLYQVNDDLYIFDMETLESRFLLTKENTVGYWIMDGKVFVTSLESQSLDSPEQYCHYYASLDNCELVPFDMTFLLSAETENCFIGLYQNELYWIKKEDFYAGQFDLAY